MRDDSDKASPFEISWLLMIMLNEGFTTPLLRAIYCRPIGKIIFLAHVVCLKFKRRWTGLNDMDS